MPGRKISKKSRMAYSTAAKRQKVKATVVVVKNDHPLPLDDVKGVIEWEDARPDRSFYGFRTIHPKKIVRITSDAPLPLE